jgi:hypothetical protein
MYITQQLTVSDAFIHFPPKVPSIVSSLALTITGRRIFMTATTLVSPEAKEAPEQLKDAEHSLPRNGNGSSQSTQPLPSDSELQKLNEEELKSAILSAWKKCERFAKKEMGQLLYWLRGKLRAQGSRNDIRDQDKGFGAWVEETIEISRRTADRWANEYGIANGLMKRQLTSRQDDQKSFAHEDDAAQEAKRRKHGRMILGNYWVPLGVYQQHEHAVEALKKHFKTSSKQEAIMKGVQYAAKTLARVERGCGRK